MGRGRRRRCREEGRNPGRRVVRTRGDREEERRDFEEERKTERMNPD